MVGDVLFAITVSGGCIIAGTILAVIFKRIADYLVKTKKWDFGDS